MPCGSKGLKEGDFHMYKRSWSLIIYGHMGHIFKMYNFFLNGNHLFFDNY